VQRKSPWGLCLYANNVALNVKLLIGSGHD
jgi:hypothetical protein